MPLICSSRRSRIFRSSAVSWKGTAGEVKRRCRHQEEEDDGGAANDAHPSGEGTSKATTASERVLRRQLGDLAQHDLYAHTSAQSQTFNMNAAEHSPSLPLHNSRTASFTSAGRCEGSWFAKALFREGRTGCGSTRGSVYFSYGLGLRAVVGPKK